jgi:hypothetical protein
MMDRKKIVTIFISVFLILLLLIIALLLIFKPFSPVIIVEPYVPGKDEVIDRQLDQLPPPSPDRVRDDGSYPLGVKQFALAYAERFASYSSDAQAKNLEDLKDISTDRLIRYLDTLIDGFSTGTGAYEAVEARGLSTSLSYTTGNEALIVVDLQLSKFNESRSESTSEYAELEIKSVRVGDQWQADEVSWQ